MSGLPKLKLGSLPPPPKASLPKVEGVLSPKQSNSTNPMKVGQQATVKTPKAKKQPDGFGKPSLFFKSEDFGNIKKPSIEKLRSFLEKKRSKTILKGQ